MSTTDPERAGLAAALAGALALDRALDAYAGTAEYRRALAIWAASLSDSELERLVAEGEAIYGSEAFDASDDWPAPATARRSRGVRRREP